MSDDIVFDRYGKGHDLQTPGVTSIVFPNAILSDEANPTVNAFQLGLDWTGGAAAKPQHLTTADRGVGDTGLASDMGINPGMPRGTDQAGAELAFAGGVSTGAGAPGNIVFVFSHPAGSGTAQNDGAPRWIMASIAGLVTFYPALTESAYIGFGGQRVGNLYSVNVETGTAAGAPGQLVLRSPNGTRYNVTVSNAGALSAVAI